MSEIKKKFEITSINIEIANVILKKGSERIETHAGIRFSGKNNTTKMPEFGWFNFWFTKVASHEDKFWKEPRNKFNIVKGYPELQNMLKLIEIHNDPNTSRGFPIEITQYTNGYLSIKFPHIIADTTKSVSKTKSKTSKPKSNKK